MTATYERPPDPGEGLRLHLNENTAGCSPAVLAVIRGLTREQCGLYPDYQGVTATCARHFGVEPEEVLLTNGLDEGILAVSIASFRGTGGGGESIVVEPAFDMYAACTDAAGGRVRAVPPQPDFAFPVDDVLDAVSAATRLVFLTNPNNPTGRPVPRTAILRVLERAPSGAYVFLDEAYAEFAGDTFVRDVRHHPKAIVGRTFAKAFGLAGLRAGALIGHPDTLAGLRPIIPPYSLNVVASTALVAAVEDRAYVSWYLAEVEASKRALYEALERLNLAYWPSAANFVLVRIGDRAGALVARLAERRVFVRDRSAQPGCAGCVRITTGVLEHTRRCIEAMEEILCGDPS
jgi:histidinol-phosphate aminotransferase